MIVPSSLSASSFLRVKLLRPMIDPNPPPACTPRTCSSSLSSVSAAPPEKDHDPPTVERAFHNVADPLGNRPNGNLLFLVNFLCRFLF